MIKPYRQSALFKKARCLYERNAFVTSLLALAALAGGIFSAGAQEAVAETYAADSTATQSHAALPVYIREYRVLDSHQLKPVEVQEAVYPYLGPGRTTDDVEHARAALEKAYKDKGFQTVSVQVPPQTARRGIVVLQVVENRVGRLRVRGSRYFAHEQIKQGAPSLAEGQVVDFENVTKDIVSLNQLPDRRVTPSLRPGVEPNTVDVDLTVKDTFPLHGSVELNNRYSQDTTELRLNGAVSYNNLWQLGHSAGMSFQISPENLDQVEVITGYYTARIPSLPQWNLTLQATKQNSNVSTLGSSPMVGKGEIIGARVNVTLPPGTGFYQFFSFGIDYKHTGNNVFGQDSTTTTLADGTVVTGTDHSRPVTYFPLTATYGATWAGKGRTTELNTDLVFHPRGLGSNTDRFDSRRYNSDGSFIYIRGDLSHTQDLPLGFQAYGKVQGQLSNSPLIDNEQFSGGGLDSVRGYLESAQLGDNALFGSAELRTPSLLGKFGGEKNEWRIYAFCDAGLLTIHSPLPEQQSRFNLASVGVGTRIRLMDHLNGSLDVGFPLILQDTIPLTTSSTVENPLLTFRVWAEF